MAEHWFVVPVVAGSNPVAHPPLFLSELFLPVEMGSEDLQKTRSMSGFFVIVPMTSSVRY